MHDGRGARRVPAHWIARYTFSTGRRRGQRHPGRRFRFVDVASGRFCSTTSTTSTLRR